MRFALMLCLFAVSFPAHAADSPGKRALEAVRGCIMQNTVPGCHAVMTEPSFPWFDKFYRYKLTPCLPTDFTYASEETTAAGTTVMATIPAGEGKIQRARLIFVSYPDGLRLDIPATLRRGLGEKWQDKMALGEQLFLMMRENMGGNLTCDMLTGLIKPKG